MKSINYILSEVCVHNTFLILLYLRYLFHEILFLWFIFLFLNKLNIISNFVKIIHELNILFVCFNDRI